MKILYISNAILPSEVSHSLSICRVCQALTDEGHDVTLISLSNSLTPDDPIEYYSLTGGFKVVKLKLPNFLKSNLSRRLLLKGMFIGWKAQNILKNEKFDAIYSRLTLSELFFIPHNIPVLYEMHSLGFFGKAYYQKIIMKSLIKFKNFKKVIVTTDMLKDMLLPHCVGVEIEIARLSAELPIQISLDEIDSFKSAHLKSNARKTIGYTGYLDNYGLRGTDIILEIAKRKPEFDFHIVGGNTEMVDYWKKKCDSLNVIFHGYKSPNLMPYFLRSFDIVLAPLQNKLANRAPSGENMSPLKLSQYMAYGCSIVASDLPSHRELLGDSERGILVEPKNIDSWCEAITKLLNDALLSKRLSESAAEFYYQNLTPSVRVEKIISGIDI